MKMESVILDLTPRHAFRISRGEKRRVRNVVVRLTSGGIEGWGEASPNPFYNETPEGVRERIHSAEALLDKARPEKPEDILRLWNDLWPTLAPSRAAQCALDLALWDLAAKQAGVSVRELATGAQSEPVVSFCTIGLSTPEEWPVKLAELEGFPRIKIKSDASGSLEMIRKVRATSPAELAVDANCAWLSTDLPDRSHALAELGVSFIEQPLPPSENAAMAACLPRCALPVFADESCVQAEDVESMKGHFDGFNIKLVKCGGLTPGLAMLRRGRELGIKVMVGCMLETSLLVSAGAVLGAATDYADLDGAWLLDDDPFVGITFARGILTPPDRPGLGVVPVRKLLQ